MPQAPAGSQAALDLLREFGGDELVRTLLTTFVSYAETQLARAEEAAAIGDAAEIARIAHALKSSALQLGAMELAAACAAAERAGAGGADVPGAIAGVVAMQTAFAEARLWMAAVAAV